MSFTTLASWPRLIWQALDAAGHDPRPLFEGEGLSPELLGQAGARFPTKRLMRLWERAAEVADVPCFGLAAARHWHPTTLHALGIAWFASPTLAEAFRRVVRHYAVATTAGHARFERTGGDYTFSVEPAPAVPVPVESMHAALAVLVRMCRQSYGSAFRPRRVLLTGPATACADALAEDFGCPLEHGRPRYGLVMPVAALERPLLTANTDILVSAERLIADYLGRLDREDVVARAKAEIMRQLPSGAVTEASVAGELHLSLRTFQRRLRERELTYRDLLESVRRELALEYIADPRHSITEISYLLGFSEPSSFARTFRRWTGHSPSQQREASVARY